MRVRVLLFASYADAVGQSELSVEMADGSILRDVVDRVRGMAGTTTLPPTPLLALNEAYASEHQTVGDGDEIAIIPPVAGG